MAAPAAGTSSGSGAGNANTPIGAAGWTPAQLESLGSMASALSQPNNANTAIGSAGYTPNQLEALGTTASSLSTGQPVNSSLAPFVAAQLPSAAYPTAGTPAATSLTNALGPSAAADINQPPPPPATPPTSAITSPSLSSLATGTPGNTSPNLSDAAQQWAAFNQNAAATAAYQNLYASQFVNPYAAYMGWSDPVTGQNFATNPLTQNIPDPNIPGAQGSNQRLAQFGPVPNFAPLDPTSGIVGTSPDVGIGESGVGISASLGGPAVSGIGTATVGAPTTGAVPGSVAPGNVGYSGPFGGDPAQGYGGLGPSAVSGITGALEGTAALSGHGVPAGIPGETGTPSSPGVPGGVPGDTGPASAATSAGYGGTMGSTGFGLGAPSAFGGPTGIGIGDASPGYGDAAAAAAGEGSAGAGAGGGGGAGGK